MSGNRPPNRPRTRWLLAWAVLAVGGLAGCSSAAGPGGSQTHALDARAHDPQTREAYMTQETPAQASPSGFLPADWQPAKPVITVDGREIAVDLVDYSSCPANDDGLCTIVSASIAFKKLTDAQAGSTIAVELPAGAKTCTLVNESKGFTGDPYTVPGHQGVYDYGLHCVWPINQGKSDYSFSLKVG